MALLPKRLGFMEVSKLVHQPTSTSKRLPPAERSWEHAITLTFSFRCNIACSFCMVEDVLGEYQGITLQKFEELIQNSDPALHNIERVTLSGGEVTLSDELPAYARLARSIPSVRHVRIQTNATRLTRRHYLDELLSAGIDEYFVSVHGPNAAICDEITQKRGSFQAIVSGMKAIQQAGACLITNTAMVGQNYQHLSEIVDTVSVFQPRSMEFWNYWPRTFGPGQEKFLVPILELQAPLHQALRRAEQYGIPPVVKWYPRCLMGEFEVYHDDGQPQLLIEPEFWEREPQFSCLYSGICEHGKGNCSGLSDAYVHQLGWEQSNLIPLRTSQPNPKENPLWKPLLRDLAPRRRDMAEISALLWRGGLKFGMMIHDFRLISAARSHNRKQVKLRLEAPNAHAEFVASLEPSGTIRLHNSHPDSPVFEVQNPTLIQELQSCWSRIVSGSE
jgi:MoaA/NifB/PqqE/SkfB family radical SAM enzyme